jgi:hypothetical protein
MDALTLLAEASGMARGLLLFLSCLLATWPASFAFRILPGGAMREVYAVVMGTALCWIAYGSVGVFNLLLMCGMTYSLCALMPEFCASVVTALAFMHLVQCHVTNASGAAWAEVDTPQPSSPPYHPLGGMLFCGRVGCRGLPRSIGSICKVIGRMNSALSSSLWVPERVWAPVHLAWRSRRSHGRDGCGRARSTLRARRWS